MYNILKTKKGEVATAQFIEKKEGDTYYYEPVSTGTDIMDMMGVPQPPPTTGSETMYKVELYGKDNDSYFFMSFPYNGASGIMIKTGFKGTSVDKLNLGTDTCTYAQFDHMNGCPLTQCVLGYNNVDNGLGFYIKNYNTTNEGEHPNRWTSLSVPLIDEIVTTWTNGTSPDDEWGYSSSTGGGSGNYTGTSDEIGLSDECKLSAVGTGLVSVFKPSWTQLSDLGHYLWSGISDFASLQKLFVNPMDSLISLAILPVNPPEGATLPIYFGNLDSGISCTTVSSQRMRIDCGTISVPEYFGNFMDFAPYTKCTLFVPFYGDVSMDIDTIQHGTIHLVYNIDLLTGDFLVEIEINSKYTQNTKQVLYQIGGNCATFIPLSQNNFSNLYSKTLSTVQSLASIMPTANSATIASTASCLSNVVGSKQSIEHTNNCSDSHGLLGQKTPYLKIERCEPSIPLDYKYFKGHRSNITGVVSSFSGFLQVESVNLTGFTCTDDELKMIENQLKEGIII